MRGRGGRGVYYYWTIDGYYGQNKDCVLYYNGTFTRTISRTSSFHFLFFFFDITFFEVPAFDEKNKLDRLESIDCLSCVME